MTPGDLHAALAEAGMEPLDPEVGLRFVAYFDLLARWNAKLNLTAIREPAEIVRRHFVESIFAARAVPSRVASLLDFGSGAGFPGIPIAICKPDIRVTLAESRAKKASFLREAVRVLGVETTVFAGRAETFPETTRFDAVTLRAVDNMEMAVSEAAGLVSDAGCLIIFATLDNESRLTGLAPDFDWESRLRVPGRSESLLLLGRRPADRQP